MAKFIKTLHDLIDAAIEQGITQFMTRAQIDDTIDQAQMTLFRRLVKEYLKTKDPIARNYLLPFEVVSNITMPTSGIGYLGPTGSSYGVEHVIDGHVDILAGAGATAPTIKYPVYFKEPNDFREAVIKLRWKAEEAKAGINPMTTVLGTIYSDGATGATANPKKLEVYPELTPVVIRYYKRPPKPVYGGTASSGQYIYDDSTSTDVSWSPMVQDILIENTLGQLGLALKEGQIQRAGQKAEPKEASI